MEVLKAMTEASGGVLSDDSMKITKREFTDNVPNLQSPSLALEFQMRSGSNSINYGDHIGLPTDFGPEIKATAEVEAMLAEGAEHVHMLYTFRSVGRAVPMPKESDPNKAELNLKTFEVLRPQIAKIKRLMDFQEKGIVIIERCMQSLVMGRERIVPDGYYDAITKVIDLLQKLDNLKDMKASLATDFSRYNRVLQACRSELDNGDQLAQEKHQLQLFLSNFKYPKSLIFQNLRDVLKRVDGHEDVLLEMLQQNIDYIENERYLTPDEKYRLIRSLPHLMLLIDGDATPPDAAGNKVKKESTNVFKDKRIKLGPLQQIFKNYPVVPEYGDMSMHMLVILRRAPHWEPSMEKQWGGEPDKKVIQRYSLPTHWPEMKAKHADFLGRFSKTTTELATYKFCKEMTACDYAAHVAKLCYEGFRFMQMWTCALLDFYHWKLTHPVTPDQLEQLGAKNASGTGAYEAALKYNLSNRERGVFVDVISMIKSLASAFNSAEAAVAPYIRLHVHHACQQFVMGDLVPPLHRAHKRSRDIIQPLLKLRRLVADWGQGGAEPADDYVKYSRNHGKVDARHVVRVVGPSPTQLQLMRTMVRAMYDPRNQTKRGFLSKKDLEKEDLAIMENFYNDSLSFLYLLNYSDTLRANSDLGDLWYREFYLELTGQIQFPIELSLPWILTEHIIRHQAEAMPLVEDILYTMDAYNDAAHRALFVLNQRFLYDEIEAELNLVFDQLVFLVADYAYSHHKDNAAASCLDETYVDRLRKTRKASAHLVEPPARRIGVPLAQRRVQLLGRVIDLNALISQHVNAKLYKDVEFCLRKFESGELSCVVDYARALAVVEKTRNALAEHLELDDFDVIVAEVDEAVGPTAFAGRAMMHVLASLVTDILPNSSYNMVTRRFVRSPAPLRFVERPKAPKADGVYLGFGARCGRAYEFANRLSRGFLGVPHYEAILAILGTSAIPLLVNNLLTNLGDRLEICKAYLDAISEGLPPCKLPKAMYGLAGVYGVFDALLKPILTYADLKPEVFQAMKEIGNTLIFVRDLSDVLERNDLERLLHAAPYVDALSLVPFTEEGIEPKAPLMLAAASVSADKDVADLAATAAELHGDLNFDGKGPSLPPAAKRSRAPKTTLFYGAVVHLAKLLEPFKATWADPAASNGVFELEATGDFHRLWSALSFLFGVQPGRYAAEASAEEEEGDEPAEQTFLTVSDDAQFGHGFHVAGAAIIYILGQKTRFDALDFSNHVLRVQTYEMSTASRDKSVGVAEKSLYDEATSFARAKMYHKRLFDLAYNAFKIAAPDLGPKPFRVLFKPPEKDVEFTPPPEVSASPPKEEPPPSKSSDNVRAAAAATEDDDDDDEEEEEPEVAEEEDEEEEEPVEQKKDRKTVVLGNSGG